MLFRAVSDEELLVANVQVGDEPAEEDCGRNGSKELGDDEPRNVAGADAGEGVAEAACDCHGGVGERSRSCEPVGGGDVGSDGEGDHFGAQPRASPDYGQQAKGRGEVAEKLSGAGSGVM